MSPTVLDALLAAIVNADQPGVVAALAGRSEAERKAAATVVLPLAAHESPYWHHLERTPEGGIVWRPEPSEASDYQPLSLQLPVLGTATFTQLRRLGAWYFFQVDEDRAAAVLLDRDPSWLTSFAAWIVRGDRWRLVRALVHAGAVDRPPGPDFLNGMIARARDGGAKPLLEDDRGEVWELFTFDGGADSLRAADDAGAGWADAIAALPDRDRVLDATLQALAMDLTAYRAAWFTGLWKRLKVTSEERAARHDTLRALLGPATAFAVEELVKDKRPLPPAELAPALTATAKKTVRGALKLLDRTPDADAALIALGHEAADIQGEVLDRLERWGAPPALRDHLDTLAATQRPRAEQLLGVTAPATPAGEVLAELPPLLGEPVAPMELNEIAPALLPALDRAWEAPRDERLVDAILRHCDQLAPFSDPLAERLVVYDDTSWFCAPAHVASAWFTRRPLTSGLASPHRTWELRLHAAAQRAALGHAAPLLALPTHSGGWIEPATFIARLELIDDPDEWELAQALLRLAPDGREAALDAAAPHIHPGGPAAAAADAVRDSGQVQIEVVAVDAVRSIDRVRVVRLAPARLSSGPVRVHLTEVEANEDDERWRGPADVNAWPQRRDLACAGAIARIGWNLEDGWSRPTGAPEVLEVLLSTGEPLSPLALRLTTLALCSANDREHLLATDLLIAAIEQGRVTTLPLREDLGFVITARLAKRLAIVAGAGSRRLTVVRDALEAVVDALEPLPARSRSPLLVLLNELCAQTDTPVTRPEARAFLATLTGSSQATRAAQALLMRD